MIGKDNISSTSRSSVSTARQKARAKARETGKRTRKQGLQAWHVFKDGRSVSLTFFRRNGWLIIISIVTVIWLMSQRYTNQSSMQNIKSLEKELRRSESEKLNAKAEYMSLIRETEMRKLMQRNRLNLDYQDRPPYILTE